MRIAWHLTMGVRASNADPELSELGQVWAEPAAQGSCQFSPIPAVSLGVTVDTNDPPPSPAVLGQVYQCGVPE